MAITNGPTEMKEKRAEKAKKDGARSWRKAKEAEKKGDKTTAGQHYGTAKKAYERAEAAEKDAKETREKFGDKTWQELKAKKPVEAK